MIPNMNNNINMRPNMNNNNMNMFPNMNNNINMMPNLNNNMNIIPNLNNNMYQDFDMNRMNDILMQQMVMKMMMEQNMNDNQINNEKTAAQLKEEEIKHYNSSKNYEIDFTRINHQKDNFTIITKKLSKFIKKLEECVKHNTKIVNEYSSEPLKDENYTNLLKLSCSIEDIYENTLRDFTSISKEIYNIYKSGVQKLKENYIKDFNKKYNAN
jgi:hypothetical protein